MKGQEKDYRGYISDDPSLGHPKVSHDVGNVQVSLLFAPPTPIKGPPKHSQPPGCTV